MIRVGFSVVLKNGTRYDANNLQVTREWGTERNLIRFVSSAHAQEFGADEVQGIEWYSTEYSAEPTGE